LAAVETAGETSEKGETRTCDGEVCSSASRAFAGRDVGDSCNGKGLKNGDGVEDVVSDSRAISSVTESESKRSRSGRRRRRLTDNSVVIDNVSLDSLDVSERAID